MVTGTPIQNSTKDLFALVFAIGVYPFTGVGQGSKMFNEHIFKPLKANQERGIKNLRTLVGCITLRRLKGLMVKDATSGEMRPLIELPTKTLLVDSIPFSDESTYSGVALTEACLSFSSENLVSFTL